MTAITRATARQGLVAAGACMALCAPATAAAAAVASAVSPLPASDYSVRSVCAPSAPGHAGCLSLQLVPITAAARAHTHPLGRTRVVPSQAPSPASFGLTPEDLHGAYSLPNTGSSTQTVALVDAYNDPNAEADLAAYGQAFGVPGECTAANGCFKQVNENGQTGNPPFPTTTLELEAARKGTLAQREEASRAEGWGLEISLDVEATRAICESCHILLVEANSSSYEDLERAEQAAIALGASEISNSWGGPEAGETPEMEASSPFNHPGIVITAAAGDNGYLGWSAPNSYERGFAAFPASSPHVVAVGGTRLSVAVGGSWAGESVWNGNGAGGGGCSVEFSAPPWQQSVAGWSGVGCEARRAVADVSADADPYTGIAVHDSSRQCEATYVEEGVKHVLHWCTIGGTSLASPVVASVFALAGGAGGVSYAARTLYENEVRSPASLHDVVSGSNGACSKGFDHETGASSCTAGEEAQSCATKLICLAGAGYDGPSGVGTPNGIAAFLPTGEGERPKPEGATRSPAPTALPVASSTSSSAGPTPPARSAPQSIQISRLSLTLNAIISLNRGRARTSQLGFAFEVNLPARVHATLAKRVRVRGRTRWQALRGAVTFNAAVGYNSRRLTGRGLLLTGLYRLTLSPVNGPARSTVFHIG